MFLRRRIVLFSTAITQRPTRHDEILDLRSPCQRHFGILARVVQLLIVIYQYQSLLSVNQPPLRMLNALDQGAVRMFERMRVSSLIYDSNSSLLKPSVQRDLRRSTFS